MKTRSVALAVVAILLLAPVTLAAEEVVMKTGEVGVVEVLETTADSVKVKGTVEESVVTITIKAKDLDPHNFYNLRNKHMESTLENHLQLAKWCIENKLFSRAKIQINKAREIDEKAVEEILKDPRVREGIAEHILEAAEAALEKGDWAEAEKYVDYILTNGPETAAAAKAEGMLSAIESVREQQRASAAADREKKIQEMKDEDEKNKAKERDQVLRPIEKDLDAGAKMAGAGLREKNGSRAKKMLEQAGMHYERAAKAVAALRERYGDHPEIDRIEADAKGEAIKCYINAGSIDSAKGSYNSAQKWGRRALSVDETSQAAKDFLARVEAAAAMASRGRWR